MTGSTLTKLHSAISGYKMPKEAMKMVTESHMVVVCGVTAAGKNTIINYLIENGNYASVVSHTTRQPRSNHGKLEKDGLNYWFVSPDRMLELVEQKAFVETKMVHGDTCYGTSIMAVRSATRDGRTPMMEIDVQGALELAEAIPHLKPLFVLPPSYDVWMQRLASRGEMSSHEKTKRMNSAIMEINTALSHPVFRLVINEEVEDTAAKIIAGVAESTKEENKSQKTAQELLSRIK